MGANLVHQCDLVNTANINYSQSKVAYIKQCGYTSTYRGYVGRGGGGLDDPWLARARGKSKKKKMNGTKPYRTVRGMDEHSGAAKTSRAISEEAPFCDTEAGPLPSPEQSKVGIGIL